MEELFVAMEVCCQPK